MLKKNDCLTCFDGGKRRKSEAIFTALGDLDELMAALGLVRAFSTKRQLEETSLGLQEDLINLGGALAGLKKVDWRRKTTVLEKKIARLSRPPRKEFVRPGANKTSAFLHLGRAIARRLERRVVGLKEKKFDGEIAWLNRLSLFLFWLAVKEEK